MNTRTDYNASSADLPITLCQCPTDLSPWATVGIHAGLKIRTRVLNGCRSSIYVMELAYNRSVWRDKNHKQGPLRCSERPTFYITRFATKRITENTVEDVCFIPITSLALIMNVGDHSRNRSCKPVSLSLIIWRETDERCIALSVVTTQGRSLLSLVWFILGT